MFPRLRNREPFGKAGLTVAICALVLAMVGAAWAAGALSGKQKKEVEKIAKKFAGKPGAAGANGATGPQGPAGPTGTQGEKGPEGKQGPPGSPGTNGKSVVTGSATAGECPESGAGATVEVAGESTTKKPVCNGKPGEEGPEGPEGSPWTVGSKLPAGATETGGWNFGEVITGENPELVKTLLSFPIQLGAARAEAIQFEFVEAAHTGTNCTGSANEPTAPPGFLCVYQGRGGSSLLAELVVPLGDGGFGHISSSGTLLALGVAAHQETEIHGAWALTG